MDKNTIIIAIIFVLLLGGIAALVQNTSLSGPTSGTSIEKKSSLTASEKLYDFGTISMAKGDVSHVFTVSNPTTQDIKVARLESSCMCTSAYIIEKDGSKKGPFKMPTMGFVPPANEIVKAGDIIKIEAVYDPNAHGPAGVGPIDRFLILTEDGADGGGELQLEIKAQVTP